MSKTTKVRIKEEYTTHEKFYSLPESLREILRNHYDSPSRNNPLILTAAYSGLENFPFNEHSRCKIAESIYYYKGYYSTKYFEEVLNEKSTEKNSFSNYDKAAAYLLKDAKSQLSGIYQEELGLSDADLYEIEDLAQDRWNEIKNAEELTFSFTLTRAEWEKLSASDPEFNKRIREKLSNNANY